MGGRRSCLIQQFGRHAEVDLRASEIRVSQVRPQVGKQVLDVSALPIPGCQSMDGEGVTKVMQARLTASGVRPTDSGVLPQALEGFLDSLLLHPRTGSRRKEWDVAIGGENNLHRSSGRVTREGLAQVHPDGYPPALVKLGPANRDRSTRQVDVAPVQRDGFTQTQPGRIEQQDEGAQREGFEAIGPSLVGVGPT
jgi:hypothetical protein